MVKVDNGSNFIYLALLQPIFEKQGLLLMQALIDDFVEIESDISDRDKYDLSRAASGDWQRELFETCDSATEKYALSCDKYPGKALLGVTEYVRDAGIVWMIQSESFARNSARWFGETWPIRVTKITRETLAEMSSRYATLFNFIPRRQAQNLRWLKASGFQIFECPYVATDIVLFVYGEKKQEISRSKIIWRQSGLVS